MGLSYLLLHRFFFGFFFRERLGRVAKLAGDIGEIVVQIEVDALDGETHGQVVAVSSILAGWGMNLNTDSIYAGIAGVKLDVESFDLGDGLVISKTFGHFMAPFLMAFA